MTEVPGYKNSVTREHIVPKSLGGSDTMDNIAAACNHCNGKRGVMPIDVFMDGFKSLKNPTIHA
jgi:5-methylcytosine-specific restriction endonuclease McrA